MGIGSELMPLLRSAVPTSIRRLTPGELLTTNLVTEPFNGRWIIDSINRRAYWAATAKLAATPEAGPATTATKAPAVAGPTPATATPSVSPPQSGLDGTSKPAWARSLTEASSAASNRAESTGSAEITLHPADKSRQDRTLTGSVTWHTGWKEDDPGPVKRPEIIADISLAEAHTNMTMTLFRSDEPAAAQPFVMQLRFTTWAQEPTKVVTLVRLPLILRGRANIGVTLPGKLLDATPNAFTLKLDPETDEQRQSGRMFLPEAWFSIPLRLEGGDSAEIVFEEGRRGLNLMNQSIRHPAVMTNG